MVCLKWEFPEHGLFLVSICLPFECHQAGYQPKNETRIWAEYCLVIPLPYPHKENCGFYRRPGVQSCGCQNLVHQCKYMAPNSESRRGQNHLVSWLICGLMEQAVKTWGNLTKQKRKQLFASQLGQPGFSLQGTECSYPFPARRRWTTS